VCSALHSNTSLVIRQAANHPVSPGEATTVGCISHTTRIQLPYRERGSDLIDFRATSTSSQTQMSAIQINITGEAIDGHVHAEGRARTQPYLGSTNACCEKVYHLDLIDREIETPAQLEVPK
jgi:hypothetical protein